jgi:regulator of sigma D
MDFKFSSTDDIQSLHPNIIDFVPRYIANRKADYLLLLDAIKNSDHEAIRDYCHKVVGTARSYHFFQLEEITKRLQEFSREKDMEAIKKLMPVYDAYIKNLFVLYLPKEDL